MHRIASAFAIAVAIVAADCIAQTQRPGDEVLAENAEVKLTRADYETELLRVPPEMRAEFAASPKRLTMMLNNLLIDKTLAKEALDVGLDRDPEVARRLALETERFYAQAMLAKIDRDAAAEFDAKYNDFLAKAREIYLINKSKYVTPEQISASHILFETGKRGDAATLALAKETRAKILAGADFNATAKQVSEDPTAKENGGQLGWFVFERMDPAFSKAAFDLKNVGDISEPVQSAFGWHIIRLDGRRPSRPIPFEQASKSIMNELKQRYVKDAHDARLEAISKDPNMKVNQAAVDALVVRLPDAPRLTAPQGPVVK